MVELNKDEINLIKKYLNNESNLDNLILKKIFTSYFPELDYEEYKLSNIWHNLIFLEFQELIIKKTTTIEKKEHDFNNLWGKGDIGPVG